MATEKDGSRSSRTLSSNTYNSWNQLSRSTYGNGQYVSYTYDDLDRVKTKQHSGITGSFSYTYDQQGNLARVKDTVNNTLTGFFYDLAGRLSEIRQTDANETQERINLEYTYDEYNRLKAYAFTIPGVSEQRMEARFGDGSAGFDAERVYGVKWNGTEVLQHVYDGLGRKTQDILKMGSTQRATQYTYLPGETAGTTTTQVGTVTYADGTVETYTYDERGYISSIHSSGDNKKVEYTYDTLGQLVREDNERENYTVTWEYDKGGNLLSRKVYAYTTGSTLGEPLSTDTYGYDDAAWGDLLTSYNGQSITYDAIGNPLSYRGAALTWKAGRQLAAWSKDGTNISYTYDDSGIRTKKVVNGETTEYYILDGTLLGMSGKVDSLPYTLVFRFDEGGNAIGFQLTVSGYGTQAYWYQRNLQGDVIGLYNSSGTLIGRYTYDAWGKLLDTTSTSTLASYVMNLNPIRYRGYLYDTETALYYCQSRYYDPEVGRWINADSLLADVNLFRYCGNCPVMFIDPSGLMTESEFMNITSLHGDAVRQYCEENNIEYGFTPSIGNIPYSATHLGDPVENIVIFGTHPKQGDPPPPSSGYKPGKKGPNRVKASGNKYGWEDANGNIWVPDYSGHAGPHWDVQGKNGYINVGADGQTWGGKGTVKLPKITVDLQNTGKAVAIGAGTVAFGYACWQAFKWTTAIIAAGSTGGMSLVIAGCTP